MIKRRLDTNHCATNTRHATSSPPSLLPPLRQRGLSSARHWLTGMMDASTNRLYYEVLPAAGGVRVHSPCSSVRDLGTGEAATI